jgi:hypothetical protein
VELGYSGVLWSKVFVTADYYRAKNKDFITDLVPQVGTILGDTEGCVPEPNLPANTPEEDLRKRCPINNEYLPWVSTLEGRRPSWVPTSRRLRRSGTRFSSRSGPTHSPTVRAEPSAPDSGSVWGKTSTESGHHRPNVRQRRPGRHAGGRFRSSVLHHPELNVLANYSWFDFTIVDTGDLLDLQEILLPNTPEHKASVGIAYNQKRWSASASGRWVQSFRWSAGFFRAKSRATRPSTSERTGA